MTDPTVMTLRLADGSAVKVKTVLNQSGSLRLVTDSPIRHCKRGHILIKETLLTNGINYRCLVCTRARNRKKQQERNKTYCKKHALKERERKRHERRNQKTQTAPAPSMVDAL